MLTQFIRLELQFSNHKKISVSQFLHSVALSSLWKFSIRHDNHWTFHFYINIIKYFMHLTDVKLWINICLEMFRLLWCWCCKDWSSFNANLCLTHCSDVSVDVPDELDISHLRAAGKQPTEQELPEDDGGQQHPAAAAPGGAVNHFINHLADICFVLLHCLS